MSTLVTGSTGLLGNNIVRALVARGDAVRVLVRPGGDLHALDGLPVEIVRGDITQREQVLDAAKGTSAIIHAAGNVHIGWTQADEQHQTNVVGTENAAAAALSEKVRLIHISSVNALGIAARDAPADENSALEQPVRCPYVRSKQQADAQVRQAMGRGLDAVILYPSFMLGPWDWKPSSGRMLLGVAHTQPWIAPAGGCSLADVRDVADAIVTARGAVLADQAPRRFVLAGHNLSYFDLWRLFAKVAGASPPRLRLRPVFGRVVGLAGDLWARWDKEPDWNSATMRMAAQWHFFSSRRAERRLGYRIRPAEQTVQDAWAWLNRRNRSTRRDKPTLSPAPPKTGRECDPLAPINNC